MSFLASTSPMGAPRRVLFFSARLLAVLVVTAANAGAQAQFSSACYVPGSGTVYRIGQYDVQSSCATGHSVFDFVTFSFAHLIAAPADLITVHNTGAGGVAHFENNGPGAAVVVVNRGPGGGLYVEGHASSAPYYALAVNNLGSGPAIGATSSDPNGTAIFNNRNGAGLGLRVDGAMSASTNGPQPAGVFAHLAGGTALRADGPAVFNGPVTFNGNTVATGTKSAIVATADGVREMYTEEATEVWFTDYGFGRLANGRAWIPLDTTFLSTLAPRTAYHVFVQSYEAASLVVTRRTSAGFEVRLGDPAGLRGPARRGAHSEFSYRLVGKRRGFADRRLRRVPLPDSLVTQMP